MNSSVNATASGKGGIGGVDNRVNLLPGDITDDNRYVALGHWQHS